MYVTNGDKSYLRHHALSIFKFAVHPALLSGTILVSGHPSPSLCFIISYPKLHLTQITPNGEDHILAALRHIDRVCEVRLTVTASQLEKMAKVMLEPFPVLTRLFISSSDRSAPLYRNVPALPAWIPGRICTMFTNDQFTRHFLSKITNASLSTSDLVKLNLSDVPPDGYISPEAKVASLTALPKL